MTETHETQIPNAVCFTAGLRSIAFSAGAIHAYLASDRDPPLVAAGVSIGALSAAAMQRAYKELQPLRTSLDLDQDPQTEAMRWSWFRKYLLEITDAPLNVLWNGIPNQKDFFADQPPVQDPLPDTYVPEAREAEKAKEIDARRELYLFVKLGHWLAKLPISVALCGRVLTYYVRSHEAYPFRWWQWTKFLGSAFLLLILLLWHTVWTPKWFPEWRFSNKNERRPWCNRLTRPLLGWLFYFSSWMMASWILLAFLVPACAVLSLVSPGRHMLLETWRWITSHPGWAAFAAVCITACSAPALHIAYKLHQKASKEKKTTPPAKSRKQGGNSFLLAGPSYVLGKALDQLEMRRALVHSYHLRQRLLKIFALRPGVSPPVDFGPTDLVIVAAPLQCAKTGNGDVATSQAWARKDTPLVDALSAALCIPGILPPGEGCGNQWDSPEGELPRHVDLVDGCMIRQNPIPAFFGYIKKTAGKSGKLLAEELSSGKEEPRRVQVIYSVPIEPLAQYPGLCSDELPNIVEVGKRSLRLSARRDTELEVRQTHSISQIKDAQGNSGDNTDETYAIWMNEIAPPSELVIHNPLSPDRKAMLRQAALGCRRTLEVLFSKELTTAGGHMNCHTLLPEVARERKPNIKDSCPGLKEVCSLCTRMLEAPKKPNERSHAIDSAAIESAEPGKDRDYAVEFPRLTGETPRIVFVTSGGVFRGSFHIGMIGALVACKIQPDLIVGASVGTLLGGALAAISVEQERCRKLAQLAELVEVFFHVDSRIALTAVLKNAARELAVRSRQIRFSPRQLRRMIRRGTRSDAGFAATGAPPAFTDALSNLLIIPTKDTAEITAKFVEGHVTEAVDLLLTSLEHDTLNELNIRTALMGASLLEPTVRRLLNLDVMPPADRLSAVQPYLNIPEKGQGVAILGTATGIHTENPVVLGVALPQTYDFVQAALASSAFPCVFAPRRDSDVHPGLGRTHVLYADGGMFDNLPFLPALQFLSRVQMDHAAKQGLDAFEFLQRRSNQPDLFIAGSLNVDPTQQVHENYDDLLSIMHRAKALQNNFKIRGFIDASEKVHEQIARLIKSEPKNRVGSGDVDNLANKLVDAAVLSIIPMDLDHLNGTFAFCRSMKLDPAKLARSIANGCFQTFQSLREAQLQPKSDVMKRSMAVLTGPEDGSERRIPGIRWAKGNGRDGNCPHFQQADKEGTPLSFACPFYEAAVGKEGDSRPEEREKARCASEVYARCVKDEVHQQAARGPSVI